MAVWVQKTFSIIATSWKNRRLVIKVYFICNTVRATVSVADASIQEHQLAFCSVTSGWLKFDTHLLPTSTLHCRILVGILSHVGHLFIPVISVIITLCALLLYVWLVSTGGSGFVVQVGQVGRHWQNLQVLRKAERWQPTVSVQITVSVISVGVKVFLKKKKLQRNSCRSGSSPVSFSVSYFPSFSLSFWPILTWSSYISAKTSSPVTLTLYSSRFRNLGDWFLSYEVTIAVKWIKKMK